MHALGLAILLPAMAAAAAGDVARWERRAPMPVATQEIGVAALGGLVYAVGGFAGPEPTTAVRRYDPIADRWSEIAPLPLALHHVAVAAAAGRLYALGGLAGAAFTAVRVVFAYDPATDAWSPCAPLPAARGAPGVAVIDDRIFVVGGLRDGRSVRDLARYDPHDDQWTTLPPMPTARDHLAGAALAGRVYAVGGRDGGRLIRATEVFDPTTARWSGRAPMPTARGGLAAAAVGGRLFAFGGEGNAAHPLGVFGETEGYDPALDLWFTLPPMPTPRHGTAAAVVSGAAYLVGGASREGFGASPASERFVPPAGAPLAIHRAIRRRGGRLVLRGRLPDLAADPATAPLTLRLLVDGLEVLAAEVPPGALARRGRRRWRLRRGATIRSDRPGVREVRLKRRRDGRIAVRLALRTGDPPPVGATVSFALAIGAERFCGSARLDRPR